jgi:Tfp pilus assembly protein PilO
MTIGTSQRWMLGAALVSVLLLMAGWFLLVTPQRSSAEQIRTDAEAQAAANVRAEAEIASLKAQYKDLPSLQKEEAQIRSRIPETPNMPALLRTLSTNAKTAGVTLVSVSPSNPVPMNQSGTNGGGGLSDPGQVSQIPVVIQVTGPFANMQLFLNSIEQMKRSMLVVSLDITRATDESTTAATNILSAQISGRVFIANPGTPKPTGQTTTSAAAESAPAS